MDHDYDPHTRKKLEKIREWIDLPPEKLTQGKRYRSAEHDCDVILVGWRGCPDGWVEVQFDDGHTELIYWNQLRNAI